jgi:hypothetical protein
MSSEQLEADYRVIAARCGTPTFERTFLRQSMAAVSAGLVSNDRTPAAVEQKITALRRNPLALVATQSDCPGQMARLADVRKTRAAIIKIAPRHNDRK